MVLCARIVPLDGVRTSVADGELCALVSGPFELVSQCDGIVLHGDAAVALCIRDELIGVKAEFAGAGAWLGNQQD